MLPTDESEVEQVVVKSVKSRPLGLDLSLEPVGSRIPEEFPAGWALQALQGLKSAQVPWLDVLSRPSPGRLGDPHAVHAHGGAGQP